MSDVKLCSVFGCDNKHVATGLCNKHYRRKKRGSSLTELSWCELSPRERLEKFTKINPDTECWIWAGSKNKKGYGQIHFEGKTRIAHRVSYEINIGGIPKNILVCHSCDNPSCINPSHLFLGTNLDNSNDKFSKGRGRALIGQENGNSKLSTDEVIKIKSMLKNNESSYSIARKFNVKGETVLSIKNKLTWSHIDV